MNRLTPSGNPTRLPIMAAATGIANVYAVYGLDEQDLKEAVVNIILSKNRRHSGDRLSPR